LQPVLYFSNHDMIFWFSLIFTATGCCLIILRSLLCTEPSLELIIVLSNNMFLISLFELLQGSDSRDLFRDVLRMSLLIWLIRARAFWFFIPNFFFCFLCFTAALDLNGDPSEPSLLGLKMKSWSDAGSIVIASGIFSTILPTESCVLFDVLLLLWIRRNFRFLFARVFRF